MKFNFNFKSIKDSLTGIDNSTIDGLKLVGYPAFVVTLLVYLGIAIKDTIVTSKFDPVAFGTGFALLTTSLGVIAAGITIKRHTEPQAQIQIQQTQQATDLNANADSTLTDSTSH